MSEVSEELLPIERNVYVYFLVVLQKALLIPVNLQLVELLQNPHVLQVVVGFQVVGLSPLEGLRHFLFRKVFGVAGVVFGEEVVANELNVFAPAFLLFVALLLSLVIELFGQVLHHLSQNVGMSEAGSHFAFEFTQLLEEPANLDVQQEDVFVRGIEVHFEESEGLVVLVDWVVALVFEFLPKFEEVELVGLVVKNYEGLYGGNNLLEIEVLLRVVVGIGLFEQCPQTRTLVVEVLCNQQEQLLFLLFFGVKLLVDDSNEFSVHHSEGPLVLANEVFECFEEAYHLALAQSR